MCGNAAFPASLVLAAGFVASGIPVSVTAQPLPRPAHTVVVILENHSYSDIIGSSSAPYINSLRGQGANFTNSHAVAHPSEPNYLALFAGTTEGLSDDSCPHTYDGANLGSGLAASGQTFAGYSESMPHDGYTGCGRGRYARKHNPWVNFSNLTPGVNLTFGSFAPDDSRLPTVAFVVPDLCNDMHDCSVATGDAWLASHIDPYVRWAATNDSLLVLTFDEDRNNTADNQIPTLFVGPMVQPGDYPVRIDHYAVLRTLEDMYGVAPTGNAAARAAITAVWQTAPVPTAPRTQITTADRGGRRTTVVSRPLAPGSSRVRPSRIQAGRPRVGHAADQEVRPE
jgi:hypothetical protein